MNGHLVLHESQFIFAFWNLDKYSTLLTRLGATFGIAQTMLNDQPHCDVPSQATVQLQPALDENEVRLDNRRPPRMRARSCQRLGVQKNRVNLSSGCNMPSTVPHAVSAPADWLVQ